jgi:hypothetical protein
MNCEGSSTLRNRLTFASPKALNKGSVFFIIDTSIDAASADGVRIFRYRILFAFAASFGIGYHPSLSVSP